MCEDMTDGAALMQGYRQGYREGNSCSRFKKLSLEIHLDDLEQVMLAKAEFYWHKLNFAGI